MKTQFNPVLCLLVLVLLLVSCGSSASPVSTNTSQPALTFSTTEPSATPASQPTWTSLPSNTPPVTPTLFPAATLAVSPTPPSGWTTYTNEYLGYSFSIPPAARFYNHGADGMMSDEVIPSGFTSSTYFTYVTSVLPADLCVIVEFGGGSIAIAPPWVPLGRFANPCPDMGIGQTYRLESASETWTIAGQPVLSQYGNKAHSDDTDAFYMEFYTFILDNGFQVLFSGRPGQNNTSIDYPAKQRAREMLASLHWFKVPDLTRPGTTCAGPFTRLLPGEKAVVSGSPSDPPNRIRSAPAKSAEVIFQVYPQTILKVVEGPVCADGLVFWKVENSLLPGGSGWTAEGDGASYWLEPYRP